MTPFKLHRPSATSTLQCRLPRTLHLLGVSIAEWRTGFAVDSVGGAVVGGLNGKLEIVEVRDERENGDQIKRDANGQNQVENGRFDVEGLKWVRNLVNPREFP